MPHYVARVNRIRHAAIDHDLAPTGHAIAFAAGVSATSVNYLLNGRPPRNQTMAALVSLFGTTLEELFELIPDNDGDSGAQQSVKGNAQPSRPVRRRVATAT